MDTTQRCRWCGSRSLLIDARWDNVCTRHYGDGFVGVMIALDDEYRRRWNRQPPRAAREEWRHVLAEINLGKARNVFDLLNWIDALLTEANCEDLP